MPRPLAVIRFPQPIWTFTATLASITACLLTAVPAPAQTRAGTSLEGDWVRRDSNYDPNDGMRISVARGQATVTFTPPSGHRAFKIGQVLWKGIADDGSLQVRGSDGRYYAGNLSIDGPDRLHIDVQHTGRGHDQSWSRAGPSIDGEWVRLGVKGEGDDGMRILVQGDDATVRYLPPTAARVLRIGTRIWREIGSGGTLELLGGDRAYRAGSFALEGSDRLLIEGARNDGLQVWVRPDHVEAVRAELARSGAGGASAGDPVATPEPEACLATSLLADRTDVSWSWGLNKIDGKAKAATVGLAGEMTGEFEGSRARYNVLTELEPAQIPGLPGAFALIWQEKSSNHSSRHHTNLTSSEYHDQWTSYRDAGYRPTNIEVYSTPAGVRYAGIWVTNDEDVDWWSRRDMTADEYGRTYGERRANGYRLVDMEAYETPNGLRYAAIWYRSCNNANWTQWRDMSRGAYQRRFDSLTALGFRVVDFESYLTSDGQRYAAIWEDVPRPRAWSVRSDRTLKGFLNAHRRNLDAGYRLIDYEAYEMDGGTRYAGVWAENDPRYRFPFRTIVDDSIEAYRSAHGVPGISVVVVQGGDVVYRRGFGWADSAGAKAAHAGTIYLTASVSKVIAGTLAARLEEQGRIDLRKPTRDYVPTLALAAHHTHTLEQLLSKTGCVWHYEEGPEPGARYYEFRMAALIQIWNNKLLRGCTPGQHYHYSTHGFTFLGAAIEAELGKPIAEVLTDELSRPFNLATLRAMTPGKNAAVAAAGDFASITLPDYDLARAYAVVNGRSALRAYEWNSWKILGGGIQSNALDLARFGWLSFDGSLVSDSVRDNRLWSPLTNGAVAWDTTTNVRRTALAWNLSGSAGNSNRVAWHTGSATGARAFLGVYRDDDLVIAILSNQRRSTTTTNNHRIRRTLAAQVRRIVLANAP